MNTGDKSLPRLNTTE